MKRIGFNAHSNEPDLLELFSSAESNSHICREAIHQFINDYGTGTIHYSANPYPLGEKRVHANVVLRDPRSVAWARNQRTGASALRIALRHYIRTNPALGIEALDDELATNPAIVEPEIITDSIRAAEQKTDSPAETCRCTELSNEVEVLKAELRQGQSQPLSNEQITEQISSMSSTINLLSQQLRHIQSQLTTDHRQGAARHERIHPAR